MEKKRKICRVHWKCQGTSVKNRRARVKTKFLIKAPETMPRQGTKGAPTWALKQQHCNKFPDGDPLDYLVLTKQPLQRTSKELCIAVLQASQNRVNLLQREFQTCREQIFSSVNNGSANYIWNGLKAENSNLLQNLKQREKRKLLKTIPLDQELFLPNNTRDLPINTATQARRYCGLHRLVRKCKLFRRKRRLLTYHISWILSIFQTCLSAKTKSICSRKDHLSAPCQKMLTGNVYTMICKPLRPKWGQWYFSLRLTLKIVKDHLVTFPKFRTKRNGSHRHQGIQNLNFFYLVLDVI